MYYGREEMPGHNHVAFPALCTKQETLREQCSLPKRLRHSERNVTID